MLLSTDVRTVVSTKFLKIRDEILDDLEVSAKDPFRLDSEAEECVKIITEELNKTIVDIM